MGYHRYIEYVDVCIRILYFPGGAPIGSHNDCANRARYPTRETIQELHSREGSLGRDGKGDPVVWRSNIRNSSSKEENRNSCEKFLVHRHPSSLSTEQSYENRMPSPLEYSVGSHENQQRANVSRLTNVGS